MEVSPNSTIILDCNDSNLSVAASITGILTFAYAVLTGTYLVLYQLSQDARQSAVEMREAKQRFGVHVATIEKVQQTISKCLEQDVTGPRGRDLDTAVGLVQSAMASMFAFNSLFDRLMVPGLDIHRRTRFKSLLRYLWFKETLITRLGKAERDIEIARSYVNDNIQIVTEAQLADMSIMDQVLYVRTRTDHMSDMIEALHEQVTGLSQSLRFDRSRRRSM
ncbi:hypothetical protein EJ05DRAFT_480141 [Pseudovirgaria hyperparasitica]|uniref:Uncharacterized protein n=1 Tax=Pseudovirgaria hyperparasitica TaxID=470096 RepID=A0A6A6VTW9_9PEZI|nr:uncharacterized protein EJ05DRAFT_480141 [Pseudovirgaria hyperparasitica]KAF2753663.1 hypothetical protein EJ05DRAFT_480141 [Pseudovirgaria hyperparasitica]